MALNKSNLLIREYENIRQILRDIYIYGCFSRDDFIENKGISGRKYDKEQQRISAYLPPKFIQKRRIDKKVFLYCKYDFLDSANNFLSDTYRNKSFTALDIMAYFFVQQLLYERQEMTLPEILEELPIVNENAVFTKDNLRVKLDDLVNKGFLCSRRNGRSVLYGLASDVWSEFTDEELYDLAIYMEFMKNVSPIEMPYNFLYRKLLLYMKCERKLSLPEVNIFHFKHNHLFNSLDNDMLLSILTAIHENRLLHIKFYGDKAEVFVIPGEIIHDSVYGRQYLYCRDISTQYHFVIRIDRLCEVTLDRDLTEQEKVYSNQMMNYSELCWCTSGVDEKLTEIVIEFRFNEDSENYILKRIKKEGHNGSLEKIGTGIYEYRISVLDPNEMIPWIRSFGERAKVVSSGDKKTEIAVYEDWKKALKKYDSL